MLSIYKNKNFLLMLSGKFVSLLGNSIHRIALTWYVLSIYGENSGKVLSLVLAASILPTALFGSILGTIVDRYNKKRIIIISDFISGFIVFLLSWLLNNDILNMQILILVTAVLSINSSLVAISINSMIPEILKDKELFKANSNSQLIDRMTILFGLSLGGILVGILGIYRVFLINGLSFIISATMEIFIRYTSDKSELMIEKEPVTFIEDFKHVISYLKQNKYLTRYIFNFTLVNFLWDPVLNVVFPYLMKYDFNVTPFEFGAVQASLPLGFCIGAIYFSKKDIFLKKDYVVFNSILGVNTSFCFITLPFLFLPLFAPSKLIIYYLSILLIISGIFSAAINIRTATSLQKVIPSNLRGKVLGITTTLSTGLIPLGGVIAGVFLGKIHSSIFFLISIIGVFLVLLLQPKKVFLLEKQSS